jgi:hypothetical protein
VRVVTPFIVPWLVASATLSGCGGQGESQREGLSTTPSFTARAPGDELTDEALPEPPRELALVSQEPARLLQATNVIDLAPLLPDDAQLVGYVMNAGGTRRFVLDARRGIYELSGLGASLQATLVFSLPDSTVAGNDGDGLPPAELTDMTLGFVSPVDLDEWFVLTAENEGYALAPGSSILQSYFCYVPEVYAWDGNSAHSVSQTLRDEGVAVRERTDAVTINQLSGQIFAQPRTFRLDTGELAGTELFVFDQSGGQPIETRRIASPGFRAGGMLAISSSLVLAHGDELYRARSFEDSIVRLGRVEGVETIEGLGLGPQDRLVILNGPGKRLYELDYLEYFPPGSDAAL